MEEIAVIGISCRFPGEADSPQGLWDMLKSGKTAWSEIPKERMNIDAFYHPDGSRQGSLSFRGAHFLRQDISAFDAAFFSITEDDAKAMDPQQRLLLEASYEAIENAGLRVEDLKGSDTCVYVGSFVKDYEQISLKDEENRPQYASTGIGTAIMSNRLSYFYDLRGASFTLDTGCSGSLVAVHLACQNLLAGKSSIALVAGAGVILTPDTMTPMTALNFLSPDGKSFSFDARANGYGRGEGVGFVVLKTLKDALRDNDPIRSVIRGTNISQDGRTAGITLPKKDAQVFNIQKTYESGGLDFAQTGYIECHGTGTKAGDLTELTAVAETLAKGREDQGPLIIGSVKPNIGHLEAAAGVAGLIKAILVVENGQIPPNANFQNPNPNIDFQGWNLKVPQELMDWPISGIRRASINCFGFGGTNAHVVIDAGEHYLEQNSPSKEQSTLADRNFNESGSSTQSPQLYLIAAPDGKGALRVAEALRDHVNTFDTNLYDLAYTLACRRSRFEWKGFVVAASRQELLYKLSIITKDDLLRSKTGTGLKIGFIFGGQGAQWATMGQDLRIFMPFEESLQACNRYLVDELGCPYNLLDEMSNPRNQSRIDSPIVSQVATTALQVALVDLYATCGICPNSVVGHSSGEIAAAYSASMISRKTAWKIAYFRGVCAANLAQNTNTEGSMCVTAMSELAAHSYLLKTGNEGHVQVACVNSPKLTTMSGDKDYIMDIVKDLRFQGIFVRELSTGIAYHSHHMQMIEGQYLTLLDDIACNNSASACKMYSSLTGKQVFGHQLGSGYWVDNMTSPVQFMEAVKSMIVEALPDNVVELSPHKILQAPFREIQEGFVDIDIPCTSTLVRDENGASGYLDALGNLWACGAPVNVENMVQLVAKESTPVTLSNLPKYPWNHSRTFWHESALSTTYRFRKYGRQDLIGAPAPDTTPWEPRWRGFLRLSESPWLHDHKLQGTVIYPAAGMISTVMEGVRQLTDDNSTIVAFEIRNMEIQKAMVIPDTPYGLEFGLSMTQLSEDDDSKPDVTLSWMLYGRTLNGPWTQYAKGLVFAHSNEHGAEVFGDEFFQTNSSVSSKYGERLKPNSLYAMAEASGLNFGPTFRNVSTVTRMGNECTGVVKVPDTRSIMPYEFEFDHLIHPATLDSVFHMLLAVDNSPMVPSFIESILISSTIPRAPGQQLICHGVLENRTLRGGELSITATLEDSMTPAILVKGFRVKQLPALDFLPHHHNLCATIEWKDDFQSSLTNSLKHLLELAVHKYAKVSILQLGGDARLSQHVMQHLVPVGARETRLQRYSICGADSDTVAFLKSVANLKPILECLEELEMNQVQALPSEFHLIICQDIAKDFQELTTLLQPGGVLLQTSKSLMDKSEATEEDPNPCTDGIQEVGFDSVTGPNALMEVFKASRAPKAVSKLTLDILILVPDNPGDDVGKLSGLLGANLRKEGHRALIKTLADVSDDQLDVANGKLVLSMLDLSNTAQFSTFHVSNLSRKGFETLKQLHATAKGILWITCGANIEPKQPENAPIIGLARTLTSEDPERTFITVDLSCLDEIKSPSISQAIVTVFEQSFLMAQAFGPYETEYAIRGGTICVPRLMPQEALNDIVENNRSEMAYTNRFFLTVPTSDSVTEVVSDVRGNDESVHFATSRLTTDADNYEVEVEFTSTALFSQDLEKTAHLSNRNNMGTDVIGVVTSLGEHVRGSFSIGDYVAAVVSDGSLRSRHRINEKFVRRIRTSTPFDFLSPWIVAYHIIINLCKIQPTQRVLVHYGTSLYGQAIIRVAQRCGAEVYTTVGGPDHLSQKCILHDTLGVPLDRIGNCDIPAWDTFLLSKSGGLKMDVVITAGKVVCPGNITSTSGTMVFITNKIDPRALLDADFGSVRSIVRFSMNELLQQQPETVAEIIETLPTFLQDLRISYERAEHFEISNVPAAIQNLLNDPSLGVSIVTATAQTMVKIPIRQEHAVLREHIDKGTYVLAGGLGGLGRSIAQLLADNGAKNLVFLSRSQKLTEEGDKMLKHLRKMGVTAKHVCANISDHDALSKAYMLGIMSDMPPISGVVQCAAVVKDSLFDMMDFNEWSSAITPKVHGSRNLVNVFGQSPAQPWFVFLASTSGIVGNRGQSNYAAANVFMDALARGGIIPGRAVSIDVGPVLDIGMVADNESTMYKLRENGFHGICAKDLLKVIEKAITGEICHGVDMPSQIILGLGTGGLLRQLQVKDPYWSRTAMYTHLNGMDQARLKSDAVDGHHERSLQDLLATSTSLGESTMIVCGAMKKKLSSMIATIGASDVNPEKTLYSYGVDSIKAVQVRIWALTEIGASLSLFSILSETPIIDLSRGMAMQLFEKKAVSSKAI